MTKVEITYHMHRYSECAETVIILPMTDKNADDLLLHQEASTLINRRNGDKGMLEMLLSRLARLQGYTYGEFVDARAHYDKAKEE